MRKRWIFGIVGVLAIFLVGCGGGDHGFVPAGPGLVGLDDTSDATAPLLTVTYTVPPSTTRTTVNILSDLASDGDIAFDPVLSTYTVTTSPPTVLFGIDSLNTHLPEYRAFLTFPLDGATGQPVVPGNASIVSADVVVFVDLFEFASAVPTFLDLVQYPFRALGSGNPAIDFDAVPLAIVPVFDFFATDVGIFVGIPVTSLMQQAQALQLLDFQVRFSRDMSVPPLSPSKPSASTGRTVVPSPRSMEGIVPRGQPEAVKPVSPADPAARRR